MGWIEKNVYPLSVDHGVELGVNLFKDIGYRLGNVVTDYSRNTKWVGPYGHLEAVYNGQGNLVSSADYMGTFNFFPGPKGFMAHRDADIVPYKKWGN